ncbi:TSUP family transporter [Hydrogenophaga sp. YM1]|uniref:TSUP family transporter n=1 Tax=Hydrogenophaga sp. YM1 TaxID=2806262 RepID=UPI00195EA67D|nr:TSUP family transporter [Hydrogenophaga sp. YM1]QRR32907.1 TSUP family transporter [Hydrogenophaga sp. YM1]
MEMQQLVAVAAVFVVAGTVKGVTGLGLPTVAIAGLSMVLPLAQAAALLVLPSLLTNVWQYLRCGVAWAVWRRTRGLCLGTAAGAWLSPLPEVASAGPWAQALTGGLLAFYGLAGLVGLRLPPPGRHDAWIGPAMGLATGALTVASGVFVMPSVPYLQSLGLNKDTLVGALGLTFTVCTLCLWISLGAGGVRTDALAASASMLLPALLGLGLGAFARQRLSEAAFKRGFQIAIGALGLAMVQRALASMGAA